MLRELFVKDFAIIESLNLTFGEGLNILTGETGAGKSIIAGALGLLLGGRAYADLIRTAKEEAVVQAVFDIGSDEDVKASLSTWGVTSDDGQLLLQRTISRTGRSRILIGDHPATIQMLSQIGGRLIDISGQYAQQLLLQEDRQLDMLDAFSGLLDRRASYQGLYDRVQHRVEALRALIAREQNRRHRRELLDFQQAEIGRAGLYADEDEALCKERSILSHAQQLYEKAYGAYTEIYEDEQACVSTLSRLARNLSEAADIDATLVPSKETLDNIVVELEDLAQSLRQYAERVHMNPERLSLVEARLDEIQGLKRKYGQTIDEILALRDNMQEELAGIDSERYNMEALRVELASDVNMLWSQAADISESRRRSARNLQQKVEAELASIGMHKARFQVELTTASRPADIDFCNASAELNSRGIDAAVFCISPNQGEALKPLSRIASGGEISRIVLAIKKIIAENYKVSTLLFDEVDTGIGGAVAEAVGEKLRQISATHQVLCITHLPQIACFGSRHYSVRKHVRGGRTVTAVTLLDEQKRLEEIARMLGGRSISERTREHAREMLKQAHGS